MHWLHSLDNIVYRVGAQCFTYTEFARVLFELREDRQFALSSGFAEAHRSASRQEQSLKQLRVEEKSQSPDKTLVLRAQATLLEDGARYLIAKPVVDAARVELHLINLLIDEVTPHVSGVIPHAFYACQKTENTLSLMWRAFLDSKVYGEKQTSTDTLSEILARGLTLPDFSGVSTRSDFLNSFNRSDFKSLHTCDLDALYEHALACLPNLPELLDYEKSLALRHDDATIRGTVPRSVRSVCTDAESSGRIS